MSSDKWKPLLASPRDDMVSLQGKLSEIVDVLNQQQQTIDYLASYKTKVEEVISEDDRQVGPNKGPTKGVLGEGSKGQAK